MHLTSLLNSLLLAAAGASAKPAACRCRPTDSCWPKVPEWQALNSSISGNLIAVRPIGLPCHDPTFDSAACQAVNSQTTNSTWRGTEPGAVQQPNWEAWPVTNESCYVDSTRSLACGQGRVPLFSAEVESAQHMQKAVKFAKKHNLRLAIKNTGHCYLGRSSAPYSLRIATHKMKSLDFVDDFVPTGCGKSKRAVKSLGPAVTIGAGVYLMDLYKAVAERNITVVAGLAHTVGPAGGYIQGGGHSPLGAWKGMASDNALEFKVVNSNGDLVVANDYQNQELFWALRGGGGGTFGVVVSVTVRTFPEVPAYVASLAISTNNTDGFWAASRDFHANLPKINDAGGSGYYYLTPQAEAANASTLVVALIFANQSDEATLRTLLTPMVTAIISHVGNDSVTFDLIFAPQTKYFFQESLAGDADTTGQIAILGSRLVSHTFLSTTTGPAHLTQALQAVNAANPGGTVIGHIVAGGQVARNNKIDSALNPAWRKTVVHLVVSSGWSPDATLAEQKAARNRVTHVQVPILKALEPDMGAYLNEADAGEEGWQASFWGSNYEKLYTLKQKLDPTGLFITTRGVGSEDWDEDGLCRVR